MNKKEDIYDLIQPKMAEIKARYPKELNIEGFEPALSSDVAEVIAWYINLVGKSDI